MTRKKEILDSAQDLRRRAEEKIKFYDDHPDIETAKLLHELRVHQFEMVMQNEELRRTHHELEESRASFFDLYNLAPIGYCTLDTQGLIMKANLTAATLLGTCRDQLLTQPLTRFIVADDQDIYALNRKQLLVAGAQQSWEMRMLRAGTFFWAHVQANSDQNALCKIVLIDITERKQAEEALHRLLMEKEILLKEIHHRVKNNLQVVMSILKLQARRVPDPATQLLFDGCTNRILSIAMIHEKLYQSTDLSNVDFKEYLQSLVDAISQTYKSPNVTCTVEMAPLFMDTDASTTCGLIANELITNSLKHAFPDGRQGTITVGLHQNSQGHNVLTVADNGIGCPSATNSTNSSSLGLQIVTGLAAQLRGKLELSTAEGCTFSITFPQPPLNTSKA